MVGIVAVTRAALLIARRASTWTIDEHLGGLSPECVAVDLRSPAQVYYGTARDYGSLRLCPAARCLRVAAALRAAPLRLRVAAAFFPALFRLGLISSSVTTREGIKPEGACLCKTCLG